MTENKTQNLGFFSFGRLQSSQLDFKEVLDKKDYISFGEKNDFPEEIIRLYHTSSPLHTALIDKTAQMATGNGWNKDLLAEGIKERLFFENRFSSDSIDVIAEKVGFDMALFGGFYLNIIFDNTGKNIAQIEHIPFQNVRAAKCYDQVTGYYVSRDWSNIKKPENKEQLLPAFNTELAANSEGNKSQILACFTYTAGMNFYPLPSYKSSFDSIKQNYELNIYNLKAIQNGFNAGMIIVNKGHYTEEEQDELYSSIKKKYTGAEAANEFIMLFAPDAESVPEIVPIVPSVTDGRFLALKESIIEDIIQGHKATSAVAGREVAGKLGSRAELEEQYDHYNKIVVQPIQKKIEDVFNRLAQINGLASVFQLNSFDFFAVAQVEEDQVDDKTAILNALNTLSPLVATKVLESMTSDEIRGLIGLAAAPTEVVAPDAIDPNINTNTAA
jgi:hypothetical protein